MVSTMAEMKSPSVKRARLGISITAGAMKDSEGSSSFLTANEVSSARQSSESQAPSEGETSNNRRAICARCHRPTPKACICEALPAQPLLLSTVEVVILQHPLEIKQHKATANRSVPLLELCLSSRSLHLCVGRRLGDDLDLQIRNKLHDVEHYQPVLVFPKLNTDVVRNDGDGDSATDKKTIHSLTSLVEQLKLDREVQVKDESLAATQPPRKVLLLVLDATWKYAREMHMANQKYRQYPSHMLQVALAPEDLDPQYQSRRFEIRGKVSATGGKKAAHQEDTSATWMCTAECVSLIVSRIEDQLGRLSSNYPATMSAEMMHESLMQPLDAMVAKWREYLNSPKTRKHDLQRGMSKKEKRKRRQLEQQLQQQQQSVAAPKSRAHSRHKQSDNGKSLLSIMTIVASVMLVAQTIIIVSVHAERAYPLGCSFQDRSYYDYKNAIFPPTGVPIKSTNDYLLVQRLGAGKFSDVFEAVDVQLERANQLSGHSTTRDVDPSTLVVLKCLKPVAEHKIKRELFVLQHASRLPNLARLLAIVVPPEYFSTPATSSSSQQVNATAHTTDTAATAISSSTTKKELHPLYLQDMPTLVLEHAHGDWLCHPNQKSGHVKDLLTEDEIRFFIFHLLVALDSLHACGIMHRDVKPRNVLINRTKKTLMLIDLGLADFFFAGDHRYNVRVASRHYKSPELLLGYEQYGTAIDLWGVGCILAGLLLRREPFFRGKDNPDQLATIVKVLGTADLYLYMAKYQIEITSEIRQVIAKVLKEGGGAREPWLSLISDPTFTPSLEGLDLVSRLLQYDHDLRLTAKEAMQHPFFDLVRVSIETDLQERQQLLSRTHLQASLLESINDF